MRQIAKPNLLPNFLAENVWKVDWDCKTSGAEANFTKISCTADIELLIFVIVSLIYSTFLLHLASSHNASNQLSSHLFSKRGVLITMIWTTIGLSLINALLLRYWKNLSYLKFIPTSTHTIFTILVNQHAIKVTALKQLFWTLLMICSFLLTEAAYLY